MLLVCIFSIIILGIIIVKRPRTIIWMGRYIRNKLLFIIEDHLKSVHCGLKATNDDSSVVDGIAKVGEVFDYFHFVLDILKTSVGY